MYPTKSKNQEAWHRQFLRMKRYGSHAVKVAARRAGGFAPQQAVGLVKLTVRRRSWSTPL